MHLVIAAVTACSVWLILSKQVFIIELYKVPNFHVLENILNVLSFSTSLSEHVESSERYYCRIGCDDFIIFTAVNCGMDYIVTLVM